MKRKVILLFYVLICMVFAVLTFAAVRYVCFDRPREAPEPLLISPAQGESWKKEARETVPAEIAAETEAPEILPTVAEDPEPTELMYCTGNRVNVRTGPGTSYPSLGKLNRGESIPALPGEGDWRPVLYGDREAYMSARYLTSRDPGSRSGENRNLPDTADPAVRRSLPDWESPVYTQVSETVCCLGDTVNVRVTAGLGGALLGQLHRGETIERTGLGTNGWSRVIFGGREAYMSSRFLSTEAPAASRSSSMARGNSPFQYSYHCSDGLLPYGIFLPRNYNGEEALPLIISLHGAGERGKDRAYFESKFLVHLFRNWEDTGLAPFDAVILCPHLTGPGCSTSWNNPASADRVFDLIDYVLENYAIDSSRIFLQGQSMGAQGCLYLGADSRACFSALVPISAYPPGRDLSRISVPVRGYSGSPFQPRPREDRVSYDFMEKVFRDQFGSENWFLRSCSHDEIPIVAFTEDQNGDGRSDLIEWMLSQ